MASTSFRTHVALRIVALPVLSAALAFGLTSTTWVMTPLLCAVLLVLVTFELIRYVETSARELSIFLRLAAHGDFTVPVPRPGKGRVFSELQEAYLILARQLQRLSQQKAADHRYLEAVVDHVGVALCCLDSAGKVTMLNQPARSLFRVPHLNSLRSFARVDERLPSLLQGLGNGERALLAVRRGDEVLQLVLFATTFEQPGARYKLVSFQDIADELERREADSWQKLISVLTHEIMNSVTPIVSLSSLLRDTMIDESCTPPQLRALQPLQPQEREDMLRSIAAIHARSSGLLEFVQAYRSFSRVPAPSFADVAVAALLERARTLMAQALDTQRIAVEVSCQPADLTLRADPLQLEQVLINLMRNAGEALEGHPAPRISLRGLRDNQGQVLLQVIDNGPGIAVEHLDSIFVPFFTTKRGGTGVGLSISRQLVRANRGSLAVRSSVGEGAVFVLRFAGC